MAGRGRNNKRSPNKQQGQDRGNNKRQDADSPFIFGIHAVSAVLERRPEQVKAIWVQSGRNDQRTDSVVKQANQIGLHIQNADNDSLDAMVYGERHQGVVAQFLGGNLWTEDDLEDLVCTLPAEGGRQPFVMVLDGVTDPHNLGACLRSANGAGVDVVIAPKDKAVGITSVARKVACGAAETTPFVQVTNLSRTLRQLQDWGVWVIGLADEEDGCLYDSKLIGPTALVMGAEGKGLRRLTRQVCDEICALPMQGSVSSLNVSVAAGVCAYEVLRQRRGKS